MNEAGRERVATLHIYEGQYEFVLRTEEGESRKFLSPGDVASVFAGEPIDSGWISPGLLRCGRVGGEHFAVGLFGGGKCRCTVTDQRGKARVLCLPVPKLLFAGHGRSYRVFAMKEDKFSPDH